MALHTKNQIYTKKHLLWPITLNITYSSPASTRSSGILWGLFLRFSFYLFSHIYQNNSPQITSHSAPPIISNKYSSMAYLVTWYQPLGRIINFQYLTGLTSYKILIWFCILDFQALYYPLSYCPRYLWGGG